MTLLRDWYLLLESIGLPRVPSTPPGIPPRR